MPDFKIDMETSLSENLDQEKQYQTIEEKAPIKRKTNEECSKKITINIEGIKMKKKKIVVSRSSTEFEIGKKIFLNKQINGLFLAS